MIFFTQRRRRPPVAAGADPADRGSRPFSPLPHPVAAGRHQPGDEQFRHAGARHRGQCAGARFRRGGLDFAGTLLGEIGDGFWHQHSQLMQPGSGPQLLGAGPWPFQQSGNLGDIFRIRPRLASSVPSQRPFYRP